MLTIAARELGKKIPLVGEILSAHDAVMHKVEEARLLSFLESLERRVTELEKKALNSPDGHVILFVAADAVRGDVAVEKIEFYSAMVAASARQQAHLDDAVDAIQGLRSLAVTDVEMLVRLGRASNGATVGGLCGLLMSSKSDESIPVCIQQTLPRILRLQALGLLLVLPAKTEPPSGFFNSRIDPFVRQEVVLSDRGRNMAQLLSALASA